MRDDLIKRLAAANPVPTDGLLHLPEPFQPWRPSKPGVVVAVAAAALMGAGVAIAAGVGAFEGTPAPPAVSSNFSQLNQVADQGTKAGFSMTFPQADVSKAHGVIEVQTADGPEDLWAAPTDRGGKCYFIDWANDPPEQDGRMYGFGGCPPETGRSLEVAGPVWIEGHPNLMTVSGSASGDAATVQMTLQDGSTLTVPVVEHLFLASIDVPAGQTGLGDVRVLKAVAFDASGNRLATWTLADHAPSRSITTRG